ncbi:hypothetical protein DFJ73DRAFT_792550 [Zopfochytrium polystomum]|nr:hypothetical protein DFJ73DRAFT_792550 [Zopfochytrium polystomum]
MRRERAFTSAPATPVASSGSIVGGSGERDGSVEFPQGSQSLPRRRRRRQEELLGSLTSSSAAPSPDGSEVGVGDDGGSETRKHRSQSKARSARSRSRAPDREGKFDDPRSSTSSSSTARPSIEDAPSGRATPPSSPQPPNKTHNRSHSLHPGQLSSGTPPASSPNLTSTSSINSSARFDAASISGSSNAGSDGIGPATERAVYVAPTSSAVTANRRKSARAKLSAAILSAKPWPLPNSSSAAALTNEAFVPEPDNVAVGTPTSQSAPVTPRIPTSGILRNGTPGPADEEARRTDQLGRLNMITAASGWDIRLRELVMKEATSAPAEPPPSHDEFDGPTKEERRKAALTAAAFVAALQSGGAVSGGDGVHPSTRASVSTVGMGGGGDGSMSIRELRSARRSLSIMNLKNAFKGGPAGPATANPAPSGSSVAPWKKREDPMDGVAADGDFVYEVPLKGDDDDDEQVAVAAEENGGYVPAPSRFAAGSRRRASTPVKPVAVAAGPGGAGAADDSAVIRSPPPQPNPSSWSAVPRSSQYTTIARGFDERLREIVLESTGRSAAAQMPRLGAGSLADNDGSAGVAMDRTKSTPVLRPTLLTSAIQRNRMASPTSPTEEVIDIDDNMDDETPYKSPVEMSPSSSSTFRSPIRRKSTSVSARRKRAMSQPGSPHVSTLFGSNAEKITSPVEPALSPSAQWPPTRGETPTLQDAGPGDSDFGLAGANKQFEARSQRPFSTDAAGARSGGSPAPNSGAAASISVISPSPSPPASPRPARQAILKTGGDSPKPLKSALKQSGTGVGGSNEKLALSLGALAPPSTSQQFSEHAEPAPQSAPLRNVIFVHRAALTYQEARILELFVGECKDTPTGFVPFSSPTSDSKIFLRFVPSSSSQVTFPATASLFNPSRQQAPSRSASSGRNRTNHDVSPTRCSNVAILCTNAIGPRIASNLGPHQGKAAASHELESAALRPAPAASTSIAADAFTPCLHRPWRKPDGSFHASSTRTPRNGIARRLWRCTLSAFSTRRANLLMKPKAPPAAGSKPRPDPSKRTASTSSVSSSSTAASSTLPPRTSSHLPLSNADTATAVVAPPAPESIRLAAPPPRPSHFLHQLQRAAVVDEPANAAAWLGEAPLRKHDSGVDVLAARGRPNGA